MSKIMVIFRSGNILACKSKILSEVDSEPQIMGGLVPLKNFVALRASVWSKNKGGPFPGFATDNYYYFY